MILSVVIPCWREAPIIGASVERARSFADEVVVADAASPDGSAEEAKAAGAQVIQSPKGRGAQLHAGALASSGDVLLFLRADARLVGPIRPAISASLGEPEVLGGSFLLRYVPSSSWASFFSSASDWRRRLLAVWRGDSGLFVRREAYFALGGYKPWPLFEDLDLARRLGRAGRTAYLREVTIEASSRRFVRLR
jgi:glycosyltransferase involved in cell wall biosynthesis